MDKLAQYRRSIQDILGNTNDPARFLRTGSLLKF